MTLQADISDLAKKLLEQCRSSGLTIGTVESCTGGLIAAALTEIPGSSDVVMAGLVTYSNQAKSALADVPNALITQYGAVSEQVVGAMAMGGHSKLGVDLCIAVTGIAGPGGGSTHKPVGLVWFSVAHRGGVSTAQKKFGDIGRDQIRMQSVLVALDMLNDAVVASQPG